ncbi:MAG TPA: SMI1/KNR4 family protein [Gemmataceae bacterium]|nr:SMI1/KNR4 family protein [Gemmataceae bacterium]
MMDYTQWLQRAIDFTQGLKALPAEVEVETNVAEPLRQATYQTLAKSCGLPIPDALRRFVTEASGHCHCTYVVDMPPEFQNQLSIALPGWRDSQIWGGPEFLPFEQIVEGPWLGTADSFKAQGFPKDARFWEHSLPLIPVGNGDYAGVYLRDNTTNPPVVYLNHEGFGGSGIIAANFDEFLTYWQQLGYIGIHFLAFFINRQTGLLDPSAFPQEVEALTTLLRGEARPDLRKPKLIMTQSDWLTCNDPELMLKWLEEEFDVDKRKLRLFCCACCRRGWDNLDGDSRAALELMERFADGLETRPGLEAARRKTANHAVQAAVDNNSLVPWYLTRHLDEPQLQVETEAHCDLIRHIFGNPFVTPVRPAIRQIQVLQHAKRVYEGNGSTLELQKALRDAGQPILAYHFVRPDHPKGCWALDLILGK